MPPSSPGWRFEDHLQQVSVIGLHETGRGWRAKARDAATLRQNHSGLGFKHQVFRSGPRTVQTTRHQARALTLFLAVHKLEGCT